MFTSTKHSRHQLMPRSTLKNTLVHEMGIHMPLLFLKYNDNVQWPLPQFQVYYRITVYTKSYRACIPLQYALLRQAYSFNALTNSSLQGKKKERKRSFWFMVQLQCIVMFVHNLNLGTQRQPFPLYVQYMTCLSKVTGVTSPLSKTA